MHVHAAPSPNWNLSHAVDSDGRGTLAYAGHSSVVLLCSRSQTVIRCLGTHKFRVSCVAFTSSGIPDSYSSSSHRRDSGVGNSNSSSSSSSSKDPVYLCAGYEDGSARCWECHTGSCVSVCKAVRPAKLSSSGSSRGKRDSLLELTAVVVPKWSGAPVVFGDALGRLLTWNLNHHHSSSSSSKSLAVLMTRPSQLKGSSSSNRSPRVCCLAAAAADIGQQQQQVVAGYEDGSVLLVDLSQGCQLASWAVHSPAAVQSMQWLAAAPAPASAPAPVAPPCPGSFNAQQKEQRQQQQQQQPAPSDGCQGQLEHCQQQQQQGQAKQDDQAQTQLAQCQQPAQDDSPVDLEQDKIHNCQAVHMAVHVSGRCQFLLTAGADRSVKLWKLPGAAGAAGDDEGAATAGQPDPSDVAAAAAPPPPSPAAVAAAPPAADASPSAAGSPVDLEPFNAAGTGLSLELLAAAQLDIASAAAAAAGGRGRGGRGGSSSGSHAGRHYGALAAVPGSLSNSGSCLVAAAGPLGSLLLVHLKPGDLRCRPLRLRSPHTRVVFQLLLLPPHSRQQQQGQQRQPPLFGTWTLISSSMDRSIAVSRLALQDATPAVAAAAAAVMTSGAAGAAAAAANSGSNTSNNGVPGILKEPLTATTTTTTSSSSSTAMGTVKTHPRSSQKAAAAGSAAVQFAGIGADAVAVSAEGCKVTWQFSGLGGHVYCCAVQRCFADALLQPPAYSAVKVAVGCGDNTIRVLTLGVRKAEGRGGSTTAPDGSTAIPGGSTTVPVGNTAAPGGSTQAPGSGSKVSVISRTSSSGRLTLLGGACSTTEAAAAAPVAADATLRSHGAAAAAAAAGAAGADMCASSSVNGNVGAAVVEAAGVGTAYSGWDDDGGSSSSSSSGSEVRAAALQPSVLLWSNISDTVTALSWHPTNPRLLAFGCGDGCLGVFDVVSNTSQLYSRRHGGPVTHLSWQQSWLADEEQQQQQQSLISYLAASPAVLFSLGSEGCLLCWPPVMLMTSSGAGNTVLLPTDVGAQVQQQLLLSGATTTSDILWTCLTWHSSGTALVSGSTAGHLVLCQLTSIQHAQQLQSNNSSQQQENAALAGSDIANLVHVTGNVITASGMAITAAAWQPAPAAHAVAASVGDGTLLAVIDRQAIYVLDCCLRHQQQQQQEVLLQLQPPQQQHHQQQQLVQGQGQPGWRQVSDDPSSTSSSNGGALMLLACCSLTAGGELQLCSVAWSNSVTLCAAVSNGSCEVLQVLQSYGNGSAWHMQQQQQQQQQLSHRSGARQGDLVPLHRITCHNGTVQCLSAFPGWPGVLLSGSKDQTVCSWRPLEAAAAAMSCSAFATPTAAAVTAAAAAGAAAAAPSAAAALVAADQVASCDGGAPADGESATASAVVAAAPAVAATSAVTAAMDAGQGHTATGEAAPPEQQQPPAARADPEGLPAAGVLPPSSSSAAAAATPAKPAPDEDAQAASSAPQAGTSHKEAAAAAAAAAPPSSTGPRTSKPLTPAARPRSRAKGAGSRQQQFICSKAHSFLPELPDVRQPQVQQQVLVDLVALAEALYPHLDTAAVSPAAACSQQASGSGMAFAAELTPLSGTRSDCWGFDALTARSLRSRHLVHNAGQLGQLDPHHHTNSSALCSGETTALCSGKADSIDVGGMGITQAFQAALGAVIDEDYEPGSWLPVMAADVSEILQQQQAAWQQRQQQEHGSGSSSSNSSHKGLTLLSASQVGMLQFISGDVGGFLRTAVAADCVTPDVVNLAAAGGSAAWGATARLAAAKMSRKPEAAEAAAVLAKAGEVVAAAAGAVCEQ